MREPRYLVDTSVLARARYDLVGTRLEELALGGRFWTCRIIDLELAYATRSNDVATVAAARRAMPEAPVSPAVMDRALDVMELMAGTGDHRGAKPVDYVIAAAAELAVPGGTPLRRRLRPDRAAHRPSRRLGGTAGHARHLNRTASWACPRPSPTWPTPWSSWPTRRNRTGAAPGE